MRVFLGTKHGEEAEEIVIPFVRSEEEQLRVFCGVKGPEESDEDSYSKKVSVEQSFIKDAANDVNSLESVREYADARFHVGNMQDSADVALSLHSALDKVEDVKEVLLGSKDGFKDDKGFSQARTQEMPDEATRVESELEGEAAGAKAPVESAETQGMAEEAERASEVAEAQQITDEAAEED